MNSVTSTSEVRERNTEEKLNSVKIDDHHPDFPVKNGSKEEQETQMGNQETENHEFSMGDFVWGKLKNQQWWPGQIYNPSDASEIAAKFQPENKKVFLVSYFGNQSYAWCYPDQLKPFQVQNFEEMIMQSKSRKFLDSVEKAVEEIGRILELKVISSSSCLQIETRVDLVNPLATNPGIKEGVVVPFSAIDELLVTYFQPAKILEILRYIAQIVSPTSLLELTVFQKLVLGFNRSRGCLELPMNQLVPEDSDLNSETVDLGSVSSPRHNGAGKKSKGKRPVVSMLSRGKKQRNMVENLVDDFDVELKKSENDVAEEVSASASKRVSASRTTKRKKIEDETESYLADKDDLSSGIPVSPSNKMGKRKKKVELSELPGEMAEKEDTASRSLSRERKKSKYLSPPYTDLSQGYKSWIYLDDFSSRTPKTSKRILDDEIISEDSLGNPTMLEAKTADLKLSSEEMFFEILAAALDTTYMKGNRYSRSVKGFFNTYRSSLYLEGSNYSRFKDFMVNQCDEKMDPSGEIGHEIGRESEANRTKENEMLQSSTGEPKMMKRKDDNKMAEDPKSKPKKEKDEKMSNELKNENERVEQDENMSQDPTSESKVEGLL